MTAAVVLAAAGLALTAAAGPTGRLRAAERHLLDNGLVLLLLPEPGSPLVSVGMAYRVGAKNEAAGTTGLAHYGEHMNFRATRRFPGREPTEGITRIGGRWSGYTWIDQTYYEATVPAERLERILDLELDRMTAALYDPADFQQERSSVIAELRSYDDPHALLYDEVLSASFLLHPYRNNTIGFLTDVLALSREDAFRFYRRFYHPNNAVLVIAGGFDPGHAGRAVRERFAPLPGAGESTHVRTAEPSQEGERRVTVRKPGAYAEVLLAFRAPALGDPDFAAMVLFDAAFAGGKGLRFLTDYPSPTDTPLLRAVVAPGLAREARTAFQASLHPYVYTVRARTEDASGLAAAEASLWRALEAAADRGFSEEERRRARRAVDTAVGLDLDTLSGRVHQLAFFEVAGGFEHLRDLPSALDRVIEADLERFARERLARRRATVGWFVPTEGVPVFAEGQAAPPARPEARRAPTPTPLGPPVRPAAPSPVRLRNGLTLDVAPVAGSAAAALRVRIDAGSVYDGAAPGLAALAASLLGRPDPGRRRAADRARPRRGPRGIPRPALPRARDRGLPRGRAGDGRRSRAAARPRRLFSGRGAARGPLTSRVRSRGHGEPPGGGGARPALRPPPPARHAGRGGPAGGRVERRGRVAGFPRALRDPGPDQDRGGGRGLGPRARAAGRASSGGARGAGRTRAGRSFTGPGPRPGHVHPRARDGRGPRAEPGAGGLAGRAAWTGRPRGLARPALPPGRDLLRGPARPRARGAGPRLLGPRHARGAARAARVLRGPDGRRARAHVRGGGADP
jgi:zinc protease